MSIIDGGSASGGDDFTQPVGTAAITLDDATADGEGYITVTASAAITLDDATADGVGAGYVSATAAITLDDVFINANTDAMAYVRANLAATELQALMRDHRLELPPPPRFADPSSPDLFRWLDFTRRIIMDEFNRLAQVVGRNYDFAVDTDIAFTDLQTWIDYVNNVTNDGLGGGGWTDPNTTPFDPDMGSPQTRYDYVSDAVQTWEAPFTGKVRVVMAGAAGNEGEDNGGPGGDGWVIRFDATVSAGQRFDLYVPNGGIINEGTGYNNGGWPGGGKGGVGGSNGAGGGGYCAMAVQGTVDIHGNAWAIAGGGGGGGGGNSGGVDGDGGDSGWPDAPAIEDPAGAKPGSFGRLGGDGGESDKGGDFNQSGGSVLSAAGSALQGADAQDGGSFSDMGGGGGGGYYGGASGEWGSVYGAGGGGGSSWINTAIGFSNIDMEHGQNNSSGYVEFYY